MKPFLFILISILIFSCGSDNDPTIITVGKTHKVTSSKIYDSEHGISYFWSKPEGPENHKSSWVINDNSVLFTPRIAGQYKLALSVETTTGKVLGIEQFDLLAIKEGSDKEVKEIIKTNSNVSKKNDPPTVKKQHNKYVMGYSIQVSSWDNKQIAESEKQKLTSLGYINSYVIKKSFSEDKIKWRVRIGPFSSITKAENIKQSLKNHNYNSFISSVKYIK